jgi:hypothetical protein
MFGFTFDDAWRGFAVDYLAYSCAILADERPEG